MSVKRVQSIVIVGGGSSGWMSAAYLSSVLPDVSVTLIESPNIPRIGVGEATTPSLNRFMHRLGFREFREWLGKTDGTIKTGILFRDWAKRNDSYWHPFENLDYFDQSTHMGHYWLREHQAQREGFRERRSFYDDFFPSTRVNAEGHRGPVLPSFAFHFNADQFGDLLRERSGRVRHVRDNVLDVVLDEQGNIAELITKENGSLHADLFVDCTGFRRLLIRKVAPFQPYESYKRSLFCDRAVVMRLPYESEQERRRRTHPYVQARGMKNGWVWSIPLHSRMSSGYVYSSGFTTPDSAERELREYWGEDVTRDATAHHIEFESGKLQDLWCRNCVAVGLSGSFVEPLESTGLAITQVGLEVLSSILDARYFDSFKSARYNMHMQKFCDDIREFIIAHYCLTRRDDTPFWKAVQHDTWIPPELEHRFETFRRLPPSIDTKGLEETWFFRDVSWFSVLLGMDFRFDAVEFPDSLVSAAEKARRLRCSLRDKMLREAPSHADYLAQELYSPSAEQEHNFRQGVYPSR